MDNREDLKSILEFLPLNLRSSTLFWPSKVVQALQILSKSPTESNVDSGEIFFLAITDLRDSLGLSSHHLASLASDGYALFFDELMSRVESKKWFEVIVPGLASLLLRLPDLLHAHYENSDSLKDAEDGEFHGVSTGLRLLDSQEAGIVFLSQELIGALLACSMFCLFPTTDRDEKCLPIINFDYLFAGLCPSYSQNQENKIMCLIHYFERICLCMPLGFVSFERRVLPESESSLHISYPKPDFWRRSKVALCCFEVRHSGLIEDQLNEAIEVDFANRYLGGGALSRGCVQEEIRFMINPELIVGMLFLPSMEDNEAIEIAGAERFSSYTGYASTFRFAGDYLDKKPKDCTGRRKTWIVAIDALCNAKKRQYAVEYLLREINKAFCGFLDQSKYQSYQKLFQDDDHAHISNAHAEISKELNKSPSKAEGSNEEPMDWMQTSPDSKDNIGIVTGNWGCGAFGGDPELKSIIQWLAASQALRPFVFYHTFQDDSLQYLEKVSNWILSHIWTVGDLWNILEEYSSQRSKGETRTGFFSWLLPSLT